MRLQMLKRFFPGMIVRLVFAHDADMDMDAKDFMGVGNGAGSQAWARGRGLNNSVQTTILFHISSPQVLVMHPVQVVHAGS